MLSREEHSNEHASDLLICCVPALVRYSVLAVNEHLHGAEVLLERFVDQEREPQLLAGMILLVDNMRRSTESRSGRRGRRKGGWAASSSMIKKV